MAKANNSGQKAGKTDKTNKDSKAPKAGGEAAAAKGGLGLEDGVAEPPAKANDQGVPPGFLLEEDDAVAEYTPTFVVRQASRKEIADHEGKDYKFVARPMKKMYLLRLQALTQDGTLIATFTVLFRPDTKNGGYRGPMPMTNREYSQYVEGRNTVIDGEDAAIKAGKVMDWDRDAKKEFEVALPENAAETVRLVRRGAKVYKQNNTGFADFPTMSGPLWDDVRAFCRDKTNRAHITAKFDKLPDPTDRNNNDN